METMGSERQAGLGSLHSKAKKVARTLILAGALVAGEGLISPGHTQEKTPTPAAKKESENKPVPLPEIVFRADVDPESFVNDPLQSAMRYRSPYNLKGERLLDVPLQGQLIFYENSLNTYGTDERARLITTTRVAHELFHQQFDQLDMDNQDEITRYFSEKYNFEKIKSCLIDKSSAYQDTYEKTRKYEGGEKRAKHFIINEFVAHAGGFKGYTPNEPEFLIDILSDTDSKNISSQYGFGPGKQERLKQLNETSGVLDEKERKEKLLLEEELRRAKKAAQPELKQELDKNPQLEWEIKSDAAVTGRAYSRFDSYYFNFKASGLNLDEEDLSFLKQHGFDIIDINRRAEECLDKMEKNKEYQQHKH